jgi:hypothetical protein
MNRPKKYMYTVNVLKSHSLLKCFLTSEVYWLEYSTVTVSQDRPSAQQEYRPYTYYVTDWSGIAPNDFEIFSE